MFSSGGPSLSAKLANIQHIPVLMAATVASDKPIEPYLIRDILKMSFESGQARAFLLHYLLNQLVTSRNVYVKLKILKLLEELMDNGHIEFKMNLRKQPEPLNEASRLRAIHTKDGGIVTECSRIRDLANKLLDKLYSDTPEMKPKQYPSPEIQSSHSEGSGKMEGFGNSSYSAPKKTSVTTDKLKILFGSSGRAPNSSTSGGPVVYDESYATMDPVPHNVNPTSTRGGGFVSGAGYNPGRFVDHGVPEGAPHRSGEAGGGWGNDSPSQPPPHSQPPPPSVPQPTVIQQQETTVYHSTLTAEENEERNTEQERRLVDDITAPGGVKAAPPRDSLSQFITRCKVLDTLAVVEYLRQKLSHRDETQLVLRTLFVVEAMLKSDIPEILPHLDLILEELRSLTSSTNTTIRAKAKKIMQQLTVEEESRISLASSGTGAAAEVPPVSVPSETILDIDGEEGGGGGGGGGAAAGQEKEHRNETLGIFEGLSLTDRPSSSHNKQQKQQQQRRQKQTITTTEHEVQQVAGPPAAVAVENASPFDDLLGLTTTSTISSTATTTNTETMRQVQGGGGGGGGGEGEMSLMDLTDDREDNFDPLATTESNGSAYKDTAVNSLLSNKQSAPPPSSGSNGIMTDLSGLDLNPTSHSDTTNLQNGMGTQFHHQLLNTNSVSISSSSGSTLDSTPLISSVGVAPPTMPRPQMMSGVYGGAAATVPGQVGYMATGPVPYARYPQAGVPYYPGQQQGAPLMYINQPYLGGNARPVQRPKVMISSDSSDSTHQPSGAGSSSFDFLTKSSKGSAFDFVKEEIDSAKKK